ncbi:MAG: hypothetical protein NXI30_26925 [bacterium]|nr:hypothetical protein [bacterium]
MRTALDGPTRARTSAPIGAEVFASERFTQDKTGVYEDFCRFGPVDRGGFVDTLEKSENGFKFEEFKRFPPSRCVCFAHNIVVVEGSRRTSRAKTRGGESEYGRMGRVR